MTATLHCGSQITHGPHGDCIGTTHLARNQVSAAKRPEGPVYCPYGCPWWLPSPDLRALAMHIQAHIDPTPLAERLDRIFGGASS